MDLESYLGKKIKVTFINNQVLYGKANLFSNKLDTEDELYDELSIETDKYPYVTFNENEVKEIEIIN
ncbi:hypothetical protein [Vagococcus fluvialis]|uniref:hypothetical protein n=1 Tax=Vagococcus fluvialis TaxID=2738 RepID=UPI002033E916|nr:hypothetical protein [Vagococcus fluvialis]MCM2138908.1 hypothetical protein [Vagococcus fluvialis]